MSNEKLKLDVVVSDIVVPDIVVSDIVVSDAVVPDVVVPEAVVGPEINIYRLHLICLCVNCGYFNPLKMPRYD